MAGYLLMFLTPAALLIGGSVAAWRMRLDRRDDIGLKPPTAAQALAALLLFLLLFAATEYLYQLWGLGEETGGWRGKYGPAALGTRIVMVALIFPIAEEFFFRGVIFGALRRKLGEAPAVLGSAAMFVLLHVQYDWRGMLLIAADAIFFGLVRSRTGSVLLTMALHILGNSYAVWQRL